MMRVLLLLGMLSGTGSAAAEDFARPPLFFAISVPNLEASVKWYTESLGLVPTVLPPSPQAKVALVRGEGLVVELVEHAEAFPLDSRLPHLQGRYLVHGLFKVGFFVRDLDAAVARLKQKGARFRGSEFRDEAARVRSVLVLDNNGNVLQLFEPLPAQRH